MAYLSVPIGKTPNNISIPKTPGASTVTWQPTYDNNAFPNMPKFEYQPNIQSPTSGMGDVVSPWQQLAQEDVNKNYQDTLAKNQAMAGTSAKQSGENLAMFGGVRNSQLNRLANRAGQNLDIQNQLAGQQQQQNQLQVNLMGEQLGKQQADYFAKNALQADLANQGFNINTVNSLNDYVNSLVEDIIKKQMGKDMQGAI